MGKMRQIVLAHDHLVGALQGGVDVSFLPHDQPWLARGLFELGSIGNRLVFGIGPVIPDDLQRVAPLDRRTGIARDHGHPAERLELGRPRPALDFHDLLDAGNLHCFRPVEGREFAPGYRRPGYHGILHARQADVGAVLRFADGDVAEIHDADLAFAEIAEVLGVLEFQIFDARHRLLRCIGCQIAKAEAASARIVDDLMIDGLHIGGP